MSFADSVLQSLQQPFQPTTAADPSGVVVRHRREDGTRSADVSRYCTPHRSAQADRHGVLLDMRTCLLVAQTLNTATQHSPIAICRKGCLINECTLNLPSADELISLPHYHTRRTFTARETVISCKVTLRQQRKPKLQPPNKPLSNDKPFLPERRWSPLITLQVLPFSTLPAASEADRISADGETFMQKQEVRGTT